MFQHICFVDLVKESAMSEWSCLVDERIVGFGFAGNHDPYKRTISAPDFGFGITSLQLSRRFLRL